MIFTILKRWRFNCSSPTFKSLHNNYINKVCYYHTRHVWESWEDQLIIDYVKNNGTKWDSLVQHCLPHRTKNACLMRWYEKLNPSYTYGPFTKVEINQLKLGVELYGEGKWKSIADHLLPARSSRQIANVWKNQVNPTLVKRKYWSKEEDDLLLKGFQHFGDSQWTAISRNYLPHRSRMAIRQRYLDHLQPSIRHIQKHPWSVHEIDILLRRTVLYGTKNSWKKVAEGLEGRTDKQCKDKYRSYIDLSRTQHGKPWSINDIQLFWELVTIYHGRWNKIASYLKRSEWECHYLFYRTVNKELKVIYDQKDIEQKEDETKPLWKHRIGNMMVQYLDLHPKAYIQKSNKSMILKLDNDDDDHNQKGIKKELQELNSNNTHSLSSSRRWTEKEDEQLKKLKDEYGEDWNNIGKYHETRTETQCKRRYRLVLQYKWNPIYLHHEPLNAEEKALIIHGVDMFGNDWVTISNTFLPQRKPQQLMRWYLNAIKHKYDDVDNDNNDDLNQNELMETKLLNHFEKLTPGTGKWTKEEDERLIYAIGIYQHQKKKKDDNDDDNEYNNSISWEKIARLVNTKRTPIQCRQHWETCLNHKITRKGIWQWNEKLQLVEVVQKYKTMYNINLTYHTNDDADDQVDEKKKNKISSRIFWEKVAKELNLGRSPWACRMKYSSMSRSATFFK